MDLSSKKEDGERRPFLEVRRKKSSRDLKEAHIAAALRAASVEDEENARKCLVLAYGDYGVLPRQMSVRRKIAAEQAIAKKALVSFNRATLTPRVKMNLDACNQLRVRALDRIV